ncbi:MAG: efflux RND transporter permease subunit [Gemmatimonadetes bacterium]|nr:efflux RND transporter permease subunit [Gemmatimonadota bacterium]
MLDSLVGRVIRARAAMLVALLGLIGAGIWAFRTLRVDAFPDLTNVQVTVLVEAPGLSPVEIERLVTYPIEVAVSGTDAVEQVRSVSKYGFSQVTVVFADGTDIFRARTLVNERLQDIRDKLPAGARASLGPLAGATSEIYLYTLEDTLHGAVGRSDSALMALRTLHDRLVRPQLRGVPGVVEVNTFGGFVRQVQVVVSPAKLAAHDLSIGDVIRAVEANSPVPAGAYLEHGSEQYILRGLGQATNLDDMKRSVVRTTGVVPVLVGDVAEVRYGPELRQGAVSRDGEGEVMSGIVMMLRGANARDVVHRVQQRVAEINRSLPPGIVLAPYYDQTELVDGTLATVEHNLLAGGFLVIAILLFFLGNLRAALLVAATIPLSLLCAFLGMRWLGLSANLMSLGAIDFGMIVDGAVVMVENLVRRLHHQPGTPADVTSVRTSDDTARHIGLAAREVGRPILFGVLIIVLVYVPVMALEGLEGRMFRPMAMTVVIALLGSLALALFVVPALATWVFRRGAREAGYSTWLARWLDSKYRRVLDATLRRPALVAGASVAVWGASLLLVPRLGTEFLPVLDEGSILLQATKDPGISLTAAGALHAAIERAIRETPEVTTVVSRMGRAEVGSDPMGMNQSDVFVMLKPRAAWRPGVDKDSLVAELEQRLNARIPGSAFGFTQPVKMRLDELISGVRSDLAVKVFGDDADVNRTTANAVAAAIRAVPGTAEVFVEATTGQSYLEVRVDRAALARHGIPVEEVKNVLAVAVGGQPVASVTDGADGTWTLNAVVQVPLEFRNGPEGIGSITLRTARGARVALAELARIRMAAGPVQVSRERAQRLVVVQANVRGRDLGGYVADVQRAIGRQVTLPAGVFLTYGGQFENQQRAMRRLRIVLPVSILLIALLLYTSLRSWRLAGLVLVNLPMAAVGGVVALWARGLHLSISAAVGFIALFGVAVLNGLVLLSTVQRLRAAGASAERSARDGARERLRPVLMTALVASIGFIPVALSHGVGAEVQRPLATVVIGGLVTSTLLTLIALPTFYAWLERRRSAAAEHHDVPNA